MGNLEDIGLHYDYSIFFRNAVYQDYFNSFETRISSAKTDEERIAYYRDIRLLTTLYSTVVYYIYPNVPAFKKIMDSDSELSTNFKAVKTMLDKSGGAQLADQFLKTATESFQ